MSDGKNGLQLRSLLRKAVNWNCLWCTFRPPSRAPTRSWSASRQHNQPVRPWSPDRAGRHLGGKVSGTRELPVVTARVPEAALAGRGAAR